MTATLARRASLGDVVADLEALAQLATAAGSTGGISGWMQNQITQLNALPNVVDNLQAIISTLTTALTNTGVVPASVPGLVRAQADLTNIMAGLPNVQLELGRLGVILYPAVSSGQFGLSTIAQLAGQGGNVAGLFSDMQSLFAFREDARSQLLGVAANPTLPPVVQQQVTQALNNLAALATPSSSIGKSVLYGVVGFALYKFVRVFV